MITLKPNPALQSLDTQMIAVLGVITANIMAIMVLQGVKDKQSGCYPCKDYSFIDELPKVSTVIIGAASLYFAYLAYMDYQNNTSNKNLFWLLIVNALVAFAAIVRIDITYTAQTPTAATIEAEVE